MSAGLTRLNTGLMLKLITEMGILSSPYFYFPLLTPSTTTTFSVWLYSTETIQREKKEEERIETSRHIFSYSINYQLL